MVFVSLEGQTLGKYRVMEPLGRGGMARVYRAYHPQLDRYVAIKVLRSDLMEGETESEAENEDFSTSSWQARFRREAQAVAALRHPNIVQVFDFDVESELYYMVMELMEGDTLKTRLNDYRVRSEKMPHGEVVRILLDVLDGLAYAHSEGMVHRDIKPGNILLTKRGQAVLGDFGIAQIVGGTRYTISGALMGTLNYMAPEQGMKGHSDVRSDIYSLGIVFYEMLTHRTPFEADTPLAVLMKHVNDPLTLPRKIDPTTPESFERIVMKALSKEPNARYQSAEDMAQALRNAAEEIEIQLPTRISLPLSFTTDEVPSESVAVFSGTERERITDVEFAEDDTDAALGQKLAPARASKAGDELVSALSSLGRVVVDKTARALQEAVEAIEDDMQETASKAKKSTETKGSVENIETDGEERPKRDTKVRPILNAAGALFVINMVAFVVAGLTGWWRVFAFGWPMELFLAAGVLSAVMTASEAIWLLAPVSILAGNGMIFFYCTVTHNWRHWVFLWVVEIVLIGGAIWLTARMARRKERARELSRAFGRALGLIFPLLSVAILGLSFVITAVSSVIGRIAS